MHQQLEKLPLKGFPFDLNYLPYNGVYFFYEQGETWGHGGDRARIVRIGTHRDGNFRNRISEHYLLDESKIDFDSRKPAPKDRSIFRKNIGRALLSRDKDKYLGIWEIDFLDKMNREKFAHLRDIRKEKTVEQQVTHVLRTNFRFRFIAMDEQAARMGSEGLESKLIGTVAGCEQCTPSSSWLGNSSPKHQIRGSGLWLVQHLRAGEMDQEDKRVFLKALTSTRQFLNERTR